MIQVHKTLISIFGNITFKGLMLFQKMLSEPVSRNMSQEACNYFKGICNPKSSFKSLTYHNLLVSCISSIFNHR